MYALRNYIFSLQRQTVRQYLLALHEALKYLMNSSVKNRRPRPVREIELACMHPGSGRSKACLSVVGRVTIWVS